MSEAGTEDPGSDPDDVAADDPAIESPVAERVSAPEPPSHEWTQPVVSPTAPLPPLTASWAGPTAPASPPPWAGGAGGWTSAMPPAPQSPSPGPSSRRLV